MPPGEVKDAFFAYVLGIIRAGIDVDVDGADMRSVLAEFSSSLDLPFDLITRVSQTRVPGSPERAVTLAFRSAVSIPIPFSFLGYHPGSIRASQKLRFAVAPVGYADPRAPGHRLVAYDLAVSSGSLLIDVDEWIDILFGDAIDDLLVRHLVFYTWRGEWTCLLEGSGRKGQSLRGYFNLKRNRIMFPIPADHDALARSLVSGMISPSAGTGK